MMDLKILKIGYIYNVILKGARKGNEASGHKVRILLLVKDLPSEKDY